MRWYNPRNWLNPKNWVSLNAGIFVLSVIVTLVFLGTLIVGIALWDVPLAQRLFLFLEITEEFPTKAIALFTAGATFGTLFLALTMILTLKRNRQEHNIIRQDNKDKEDRDRKERYLNEIIQWANDVNTRVYDFNILTGEMYTEDRNTIWILSSLANKGKYIETIAEYIFGNPLKDSIKATVLAMGIYAQTIVYFTEHNFEILSMPRDEIDRIVKELDEAIAEDHRNSMGGIPGGIPSTAMQDAFRTKFAESMRVKATITLDICAKLKDDLLNK